jgi:hypothetical protein
MHIAHIEVGSNKAQEYRRLPAKLVTGTGRAGNGRSGGPGGDRERDGGVGCRRVPGRAAELFVREQVVLLLKGRDL